MEFERWLPIIGVVVAALISAFASTTGAVLVFRRAGQTLGLQREAKTAELKVAADKAEIDAAQIQLTDKQYQAQREQMATEVTAKMGEMYNRLLTDANAALDRLQADVTLLKAEVADCERRAAEHRIRLAALERWACQRGWTGPEGEHA